MKLETTVLNSLAAFALMGGAALAQDQMTLKFSHVFPADHWLWAEGGKVFADEVEKATEGRIKIEVYPAAQLGKQTVGVVQSGLAEMGLVAPSYESDKLPLSSVVELPGVIKSSCEGTAKFWNLSVEGAPLYEAEYKALGIRPVYSDVLAPYQLMTTKKKIEDVGDIAGLKLRANGPAMSATATALGAVPVTVTSAEVYDSMSRGTVDGGLWSIGSTFAFSLENVLQHTVMPSKLGSGSTFTVINEEVWQSFDDATRKVFMDAGQKTMAHLCAYIDQRDLDVQDKLVKENGLQVTELSDAELAEWDAALKSVADEWAEKMNASGRPGTEILEALKSVPDSL